MTTNENNKLGDQRKMQILDDLQEKNIQVNSSMEADRSLRNKKDLLTREGR